VIYLGTGSDSVRSNVSTGRGIYKSTDAGQTWKFIGLYNAGQIGAVRIHPTNPNIVWVSAVGDIFNQTKKEACSRQLTAARRGAGCCFSQTRSVRWMSNFNRKSGCGLCLVVITRT
jgi:hypothetical protein